MPKEVKQKKCANPLCEKVWFVPFKTTDKYCGAKCYYACNKTQEKPRKGINPVSEKRKEENKVYKERRPLFLAKPENQICFIKGCCRRSTTIEHRMGRKGYADDWAKENGITLFLDERFWAGSCWEHNIELESNSELAKEYQLSKIHGGKKIK